MPPSRASRRQEPVSCESCRRKKLRCDRNIPCHNCQSRAIACVFHGNNPGAISKNDQKDELRALRAENAAINARLERLESAVYNGHRDTGSTEPNSIPVGAEVDVSIVPAVDLNVHDDVNNLELSAMASEALPPLSPFSTPRVYGLKHLRKEISRSGCTGILLPRQAEALLLLDRYTEHAHGLQHILYMPHVRQHVNDIYTALCSPFSVVLKYGHLALLLSILTSVAEWAQDDPADDLFPTRSENLALSTYWLRCCLDIHDHAWRTTGPEIGILQSKMLTTFLLYHREGASAKARRLLEDSISEARSLGLHMTDRPQVKPSAKTTLDVIEIELRRRIWWHLVSTDWTLALFSGDYFGSYSVLPKHMQVQKPRNINDEDLIEQPPDFERPAEEPTSTTYYLSRIALGTICREVVDILIEIQSPSGFQQVTYQRVIDLDGKFGELLRNMPESLRVDVGDHTAKLQGPLSQDQRQRYFTRLTTEARRCKLHMPYLLRVSQNEEYNFSRQQCLQSARNIIWIMNVRPMSDADLWETVMLHHFTCAIIILAIDICVNPQAADLEGRRSEAKAAIKNLDRVQDQSAPVASFLKSLRSILAKYNVNLSETHEILSGDTWPEQPGQVALRGLQPNDAFDTAIAQPTDMDLDFDELWQSYLQFDASQSGELLAFDQYAG